MEKLDEDCLAAFTVRHLLLHDPAGAKRELVSAEELVGSRPVRDEDWQVVHDEVVAVGPLL